MAIRHNGMKDHDILIEIKTAMGYFKERFIAGNKRMELIEGRLGMLEKKQAYIIGGAIVASTVVSLVFWLMREMV